MKLNAILNCSKSKYLIEHNVAKVELVSYPNFDKIIDQKKNSYFIYKYKYYLYLNN